MQSISLTFSILPSFFFSLFCAVLHTCCVRRCSAFFFHLSVWLFSYRSWSASPRFSRHSSHTFSLIFLDWFIIIFFLSGVVDPAGPDGGGRGGASPRQPGSGSHVPRQQHPRHQMLPGTAWPGKGKGLCKSDEHPLKGSCFHLKGQMIDFTKFEHMISFLNGLYLGKNTFFKIYDMKIPIL